MKSHELLKKTISPVGIKALASRLHLSTALIYKWCEPNTQTEKASAINPLDRIVQIYEQTNDIGPIAWLCQRANGFFTRNPGVNRRPVTELIKSTQEIISEFSELLDAVSVSISDDNQIDAVEAARIRHSWEALKTFTESFIVACMTSAK